MPHTRRAEGPAPAVTVQQPKHIAEAEANQGDAVLPLRVSTLAQLTQQGAWQIALPHARDEHMFIWITRGQGRATIRGLRRGIGANNVIYLPPGAQFSLEIGNQCFGQALILRDGDHRLLPNTVQHLRMRDVAAQGELSAIVEMIQRELQHPQPLQAEALLAKFNLAAVWLRRQMLVMLDDTDRVSPALTTRETAGQRLSRRFADQVEEQYRAGHSMADFAEMLDVSPTHLTRVLRENAGMTAADLLTARVLHAARTLLAQPDPPVQNVAKHLGFGSAAYFTRFIQNHTGKTPSSLRRAMNPAAKPPQHPGTAPVFRHQGSGR
ncbi:AraC family transcriptional regulator [Marinovum sp. 2_MG-2023]|uniref:helix-turn-helix transcriptional regulator n=1 Tax=unclassified Marinovum TaxID=2647166 RepID=UPI0026E21529|nr:MULTISPECIES: AraC family transcriptional regulator [unclassified Marinovum]MDO6732216.1 AraC family transcriptional regulator [Marinovum sp. 2_MG-2023]MDO6781564.1 AraC family transcriptional regulator [Marinovum sp. 1_MG-2023]